MKDRYRIKAVLNRICAADIAKKMHDGFIDLTERKLPNGIEYLFEIPSGYSILDVRNHLDALYATVAKPVDLVDYMGRVGVIVVTKDFPPVVRFKYEDLQQDKLLIGYDRQGKPCYHPLNTHLLIGGASGAGKSDGFKFYIFQLWLQGYEIWIADLKGFTYMEFELLPGVHVASNIFQAKNMMLKVEKELNRRKKAVIDARSKSVIDTFQPLAVIIDEAASLAPSQHTDDNFKAYAKICDRVISLIGQQGREPRIFCLYCTQRPDATVLNRQYKANVEASIAFRVKDHFNSEIIIGRAGAEKISPKNKGRCIYAYDVDYELQVPYVGDPSERNNDPDWHELLTPFRTEIIYAGSSERKDVPRNYFECDEETPVSDNISHLPIVSESQKATESSFKVSSETEETEVDRGYPDAESDDWNEDMEIDESRQTGN